MGIMDTRGSSGHWVSLDERAWHIETVWQAAKDVPVDEIALSSIQEIDEDCWFKGCPASVRDVVDHVRRINDADLELPIILASNGQVLDGMHRVAKALMHGRATVPAQRLPSDPEPDWLLPKSG